MAKVITGGASAALILASLTGCQLFSGLSPYANTVSTQSVAIGILNPLSGQVDVEDQLLLTVFVSDAAEINNIEDAPITGADARFATSAGGEDLSEVESGLYYAVAGSGGLSYEAGTLYQMEVETEEGIHLSQATAPEPAGFAEAGSCIPANQAKTLTITGGSYKRLVGVVFDQAGNKTWSNLPEETSDIVDFIKADDATGSLIVPASAFPNTETLYGVVVAGINEGGSYSDNLNPLLSRFFVGGGKLGLLATYSSAELCANLPK